MRCLFLSAKRYSINNSIIRGFTDNNWSISVIDYEDFFAAIINRFISRTSFLPNRIKSIWMEPYLTGINKRYLDVFRETEPELILIYNNQLINPQTVKEMRKHSKIAFFLGDNPLYSPTNIYNLELLRYADYIICPDSFWKGQIERMGIKNIVVDFLGFDDAVYYPFTPTEEELALYGSDFVYIGHSHRSGWGYKRFLFLNHFADYNLKAFMVGTGYNDFWKNLFPELEKRVFSPPKSGQFNQRFTNLIYNCSKIGPVELVPSYFKGIHPRVFDLLGSGILPFCEASDDLKKLFEGIDIPLIYHYEEIPDKAKLLLGNDSLRVELVKQMRERVVAKHHPAAVVKRIIDSISF